jgi:hypothetical protein
MFWAFRNMQKTKIATKKPSKIAKLAKALAFEATHFTHFIELQKSHEGPRKGPEESLESLPTKIKKGTCCLKFDPKMDPKGDPRCGQKLIKEEPKHCLEHGPETT